jgi:hypothetical protein
MEDVLATLNPSQRKAVGDLLRDALVMIEQLKKAVTEQTALVQKAEQLMEEQSALNDVMYAMLDGTKKPLEECYRCVHKKVVCPDHD